MKKRNRRNRKKICKQSRTSHGCKHGSWRIDDRPDPYSSGPWYGYWREHDI